MAAVVPSKACLRCQRSFPVTEYAYGGRASLCDSCRDDAPMSKWESIEAARRARLHSARRKRKARLVTERQRPYVQRRAA